MSFGLIHFPWQGDNVLYSSFLGKEFRHGQLHSITQEDGNASQRTAVLKWPLSYASPCGCYHPREHWTLAASSRWQSARWKSVVITTGQKLSCHMCGKYHFHFPMLSSYCSIYIKYIVCFRCICIHTHAKINMYMLNTDMCQKAEHEQMCRHRH